MVPPLVAPLALVYSRLIAHDGYVSTTPTTSMLAKAASGRNVLDEAHWTCEANSVPVLMLSSAMGSSLT